MRFRIGAATVAGLLLFGFGRRRAALRILLSCLALLFVVGLPLGCGGGLHLDFDFNFYRRGKGNVHG
jgi:hypothetical protein